MPNTRVTRRRFLADTALGALAAAGGLTVSGRGGYGPGRRARPLRLHRAGDAGTNHLNGRGRS
jgi:hypothetical protein